MNGTSNTGVIIDHPEAAATVPTASAVAAAMMGASDEVATLVISALATEGFVGSGLFSSLAFFSIFVVVVLHVWILSRSTPWPLTLSVNCTPPWWTS